MVARGHCHIQASLAVAQELVKRTWTVLTRHQLDQLRDVDQEPVTIRASKEIIASRYFAPEQVRKPFTGAQRRHPPSQAHRVSRGAQHRRPPSSAAPARDDAEEMSRWSAQRRTSAMAVEDERP